MEPASSTAPTGLSFDVEYQSVADAANPDLRGRGKLIIDPAGPFYRFTGDARAFLGRPTAVEFHPEEIRNVSVVGRRAGFDTPIGVAGKKRQPFVFYTGNPAEAVAIARLLPPDRDEEFVSSQDFAHQLYRLPAARSPWTCITNLIVAANVAAFIVMGLLGAGWVETADMTPYVRWVANNGAATTDGEWWRIVTSMFVHYGLLHLALNMWALFQTGHFVERLFGRPLFALGYLGSGIVASFASIYWHGDQIWSAGASGAVFGVYGLLLGFMVRERQSIPPPVLRPLFKSTLMFAGYNLVFGFVYPRIDNAAHLGGLLGGVVLGWLMALPIAPEARARQTSARLLLGTAVLAGACTTGVLLAPRFPYRFRERLQLQTVSSALNERELVKLQEQEQQLANAQSAHRADRLADWIEAEMIPFYEAMRAEFEAVHLTPGLQTDQARRLMVGRTDAKLRHYRQLVADLRAKKPDALQRYLAAEESALKSAPSSPP
ncbi:rhomboid family intramembrane serine protease [Opitutus terrae]|uniref:Rhomboid family protein n=1 Tax=Opitutus terrae (strain DSM 11246 / JCM 15787 / PB90-1) TaxID=452637 RepID=B1ZNV7_OPITP|nr:rhomboid family intramembrane serine protease [Opitutus terrae]ACB75477.1 Rhomboid family protein [Opitutus terrae PB90-1]